jgi:chemotaxis protein methyltransferase CheR
MEELEYNYIKRQILKLTGVDLNFYKTPQMQRRLKAYLLRSGYSNWPKFFRAIQADTTELNKFKNYLTINVSSFFRDPEKYKYLQTQILPELLRRRSALRVWSAGCSRGQEIYSLAMLLGETSGPNFQHQLLATDIDRSALDWARAGGPYTPEDVAHITPNLRICYLDIQQKNQYWVREELRRRVTFRVHNLLADSITGKFDLIVCRNVVIYFQPEAKETLYRKFYEALRPGGVLFVGGTEILSRTAAEGFEIANISFYRRRDGVNGDYPAFRAGQKR